MAVNDLALEVLMRFQATAQVCRSGLGTSTVDEQKVRRPSGRQSVWISVRFVSGKDGLDFFGLSVWAIVTQFVSQVQAKRAEQPSA
jgi:hypothetical protein